MFFVVLAVVPEAAKACVRRKHLHCNAQRAVEHSAHPLRADLPLSRLEVRWVLEAEGEEPALQRLDLTFLIDGFS